MTSSSDDSDELHEEVLGHIIGGIMSCATSIVMRKRKLLALYPQQDRDLVLDVDDDDEREEEPRVKRKRRSPQWFPLNFDSVTFQHHFRITRSRFELLQAAIADSYHARASRRGRHVKCTVTKGLLMCLHHMAAGANYRAVAHRFGESKASAWRAIARCRKAIVALKNDWITWPKTEANRTSVAAGMSGLGGINRCLGAVDATQIPFKPTTDVDWLAANRKQYISTVLHAICDHRTRFTNILAGMYGSQHDAQILRFSSVCLRQMDPQNEDKPIPPGYYVVGDASYPLLDWLLTPEPVEKSAE